MLTDYQNGRRIYPYPAFFISYLFYLLPLAILTGPFIPDLFISIIAIVFLFYAFKYKLFKYFNNYYFYFLISFNIYLILNSLASEFSYFSLESSIFYFRFTIFSLAVWFLIEHIDGVLKKFTIALLSTFVIALIDGYFQYFLGHNLFGHVYDWSRGSVRLRLLLNDKMILGGYLARLLPLLIALIIYNFKTTRKSYFIIFILFILSDILIYVSGERTALGLLFLSSIFMIFLMSKFKALRVVTLIISIIVILAITFYNPQVKERNVDLTINQIAVTDGNSNNRFNLFSLAHESHFKTAVNIFYDHPILGSGVNTFRKLCNDEKYKIDELSCSTHPHNTYVQLLSETGVIGLLIFLIVPLYVLYQITLHLIALFSNSGRRIEDYQICVIAAILLTIWPLLPTQNFFNNWINGIYYMPIGIFLYFDSNLKGDNH